MYESLAGILDRADEALGSALRAAPPGALDRAASIVRRVRNRIDYPDDLAIVALAGGTGSGKSSLFNALLDSEEAEVGGVRPTTSTPMVSLPEGREREIEGYLTRFGPVEVVTHPEPRGLVLIDLPDTDSVETAHRMTVEELLPLLDAVVWVVDIEKYRDDALHSGFLAPLVGEGDRFVFALNQVDRLSSPDREVVAQDFRLSLIEDGYAEPTVYPVAARPTAGPPLGVEELGTDLDALAEGSVPLKTVADLEAAVVALVEAIGSGSLDFDRRWEEVRRSVASRAVRGDPVGAGREGAAFFTTIASEATGIVSAAALDVSARLGEWVGRLTREAAVSHGPEAAAAAAESSRIAVVEDGLEEEIDRRLRPAMSDRASAIADLASLATAVREWRARSGR